MQFDPKLHEFANEVRQVREGEMFWGCDGNVYAWRKDFDSGSVHPIIRPLVHDLAWALREMARNPFKEYEAEHVALRGWRYRFAANDDGESFFEEQDGGGEWVRTEVFTEFERECTSWRHAAIAPKEVSREAVLASPEGACWWHVDCGHDIYFRRTAIGIETVDVLTGTVEEPAEENDFEKIWKSGWSPCPVEPVVGSDEWARVCCRDLGKKLTWFGWPNPNWYAVWDGSQYIDENGKPISCGLFAKDGWSIWSPPQPPPALTLESLAERVARLEEALDEMPTGTVRRLYAESEFRQAVAKAVYVSVKAGLGQMDLERCAIDVLNTISLMSGRTDESWQALCRKLGIEQERGEA